MHSSVPDGRAVISLKIETPSDLCDQFVIHSCRFDEKHAGRTDSDLKILRIGRFTTVEGKINIPTDLLAKCLQHIRDFDSAHFDAVKMMIWIDCPSLPSKAVEEIYRGIKPPFGYIATTPLNPSN